MSNHRNDYSRVAEMLKALSHPHRLSIFMRLAACCPDGPEQCTPRKAGAYVGELGKDLGIAPSTVSHHIKELSRAGLINLRRSGQFIECCVRPETLKELSRFFELEETHVG